MSKILIHNKIKKYIDNSSNVYIIYYGGSKPGFKRKIKPLEVIDIYQSFFLFRAFCYNSNEERHFYTNKIELPVEEGSKKFSKNIINADKDILLILKKSLEGKNSEIIAEFINWKKSHVDRARTGFRNRGIYIPRPNNRKIIPSNLKKPIKLIKTKKDSSTKKTNKLDNIENIIIQMSNDGKGPTEISKVVGRTVKSIGKTKLRLKKIGFKFPELETPKNDFKSIKNRILELKSLNMPVSKIEKKLNISSNFIRKNLKKMYIDGEYIPNFKSNFDQDEDYIYELNIIKKMLKEKKSYSQITNYLGISKSKLKEYVFVHSL